MNSLWFAARALVGHAPRLVYAVALAAFMAGLVTALPSRAAQLVMFEEESCEWCEMWRQEVGPVYDQTDEGKVAPLRRVDIHSTRPGDLAHIKRVRFTPTFVILDEGREVGRILGYPGEDMFYGMLGEILGKITKPAS